MYQSPYGKPEGLADRLAQWSYDLGHKSQYPWQGLGLIADLECAVRLLNGQPAEQEFDL